MARPNYNYEKRQKELAKQKKAEDKRLRRLEKRQGPADEEAVETVDGEAAPSADESTDNPKAGE